ncbi:histidine kinase [Sphaerobacter thermophilus]|uniref:sensor histidine kinase n=1 Tax=Sphaerobacter thermophilus TaxID=2057 RepID=UPI0039C1CCED
MSLPPPQTKEFALRLETLAAECRAELEEGSKALQEIALLVSQTASEVDRLSQRELQLANRVREMDANLESYARSDIRDMLRAAHDVELRLLMMRSQLEQLQERERTIRDHQERLRTLVDLAETYLTIQGARSGAGDMRTRGLRHGATVALPSVPFADIIQAQEDERLRLAQRVVDGPAQALANILLEAEVCERLMERDPEQARTELAELRRIAAEALAHSRRMLLELRPVVLRELGVVPTLRRYLTQVSRNRPIEGHIDGPDHDGDLAEPVRLALYRLLQEAIAAAVADDGVQAIDIDVRYEDAQVTARIEVRGQGLERNQTLPRLRTDETVQRRLDHLGAELHFEPVDDTATRLALVIPLA